MSGAHWSIVLAAGRRVRWSDATSGGSESVRPPTGVRTLLEATLDRVSLLVPPSRVVTVADRSLREYVEPLRGRTAPGRIVHQPEDRGTAAGALIGLAEVLARDADAVVVLSPSDQAFVPPAEFRETIRAAIDHVTTARTDIVLFGAVPTAPSSDFDWIVPLSTRKHQSGFMRVAGLIQTPPPELAGHLLMLGAVWNTMVVVARASALLDLYRRHLPLLFDVGLQLLDARGPARDALRLMLYRDLPRADFSRELLARGAGLLAHVWPAPAGWTRIGTPRHLDMSLPDRARLPHIA